MKGCADDDVERAVRDGRILRTHVLRPTWHLVVPEDIRWMLALTAPRVRASMAYYGRKLGLTDRLFNRSNDLIARALAGSNHLTREELAGVLARAGIEAAGQRLGHLMLRAELDAAICSGPRRGKQLTVETGPEAPAFGGALSRARRRLMSAIGRWRLTCGDLDPYRRRPLGLPSWSDEGPVTSKRGTR